MRIRRRRTCWPWQVQRFYGSRSGARAISAQVCFERKVEVKSVGFKKVAEKIAKVQHDTVEKVTEKTQKVLDDVSD